MSRFSFRSSPFGVSSVLFVLAVRAVRSMSCGCRGVDAETAGCRLVFRPVWASSLCLFDWRFRVGVSLVGSVWASRFSSRFLFRRVSRVGVVLPRRFCRLGFPCRRVVSSVLSVADVVLFVLVPSGVSCGVGSLWHGRRGGEAVRG